MAQESPIPTRTALAVAAAACSLTLAGGVTTAALFGYVGTGRRSFSPDTAPTTSATEADLKVPTSGVVLVPVQPATVAPAVDANGEEPQGLLLASARHKDSDDHFRGGERGRGEDEDEHDDD
jgi:hypothetical protein